MSDFNDQMDKLVNKFVDDVVDLTHKMTLTALHGMLEDAPARTLGGIGQSIAFIQKVTTKAQKKVKKIAKKVAKSTRKSIVKKTKKIAKQDKAKDARGDAKNDARRAWRLREKVRNRNHDPENFPVLKQADQEWLDGYNVKHPT